MQKIDKRWPEMMQKLRRLYSEMMLLTNFDR